MDGQESQARGAPPRRKMWFLIGLAAGMLLFPWLAGHPYRDSWLRIWEHTERGWSIVTRGAELLLGCAKRWLGNALDYVRAKLGLRSRGNLAPDGEVRLSLPQLLTSCPCTLTIPGVEPAWADTPNGPRGSRAVASVIVSPHLFEGTRYPAMYS